MKTNQKELDKQYDLILKAQAKEEKTHFIFTSFIIVITLSTTLICLLFSYNSYIATKDATSKVVSNEATYYQTLSVSYNNGPVLDLQGIGNGYVLQSPKTITITNDGNTDITFNIKLTSIKSSLSSTNDLIYTITKDNEISSEKALPLNDENLIQEVVIHAEETITYTVNVSFKGVLGLNDYSNYYSANLQIVQKNGTTNLIG